jgi:pyridoxamine 5'-phosphate oxidase
MGFDELREEYEGRALSEAELAADPFEQFRIWFDQAVETQMPLANGMTLATSGRDGQPSARVVLLKDIDHGFVFFTNYDSRKGRDLAVNPRAALLLWWQPLHRQVRIEGVVEQISAEESDAYFRTRPRESNLSAMASAQSHVVRDRKALESAVTDLRNHWADRDLERPGVWGGYRLIPNCFEFFQGRADRLHDRLRFLLRGESWAVDRLSP